VRSMLKKCGAQPIYSVRCCSDGDSLCKAKPCTADRDALECGGRAWFWSSPEFETKHNVSHLVPFGSCWIV
jgi:hypothetical protein